MPPPSLHLGLAFPSAVAHIAAFVSRGQTTIAQALPMAAICAVQKSPSLTVAESWLSTVVSAVRLTVSRTIRFQTHPTRSGRGRYRLVQSAGLATWDIHLDHPDRSCGQGGRGDFPRTADGGVSRLQRVG